jgi:Golgi phosphoprotein 3 (GPP34)
MVTLIAEDLLLLLLDDETGRGPAGLDLRPVLGGAVLLELALAGTVEPGPSSAWGTSRVRTVAGGAELEDPVLREAVAEIATKERSAQDLVGRLGKGLQERLSVRLVERGILERREGRVLGLFPTTTWPAADSRHEADVRRALAAVLIQGRDPDPRTGAIVALLSAVDRAHKVVDRAGLPASQVRKRAKQVAEGAWAAKAVRDAITAAATAVTMTVVTAGVVTGS